MPKFRITGDMQKVGFRGREFEADSVEIMNDTYVLKKGGEIVAAFPKDGVKSIERIEGNTTEE